MLDMLLVLFSPKLLKDLHSYDTDQVYSMLRKIMDLF